MAWDFLMTNKVNEESIISKETEMPEEIMKQHLLSMKYVGLWLTEDVLKIREIMALRSGIEGPIIMNVLLSWAINLAETAYTMTLKLKTYREDWVAFGQELSKEEYDNWTLFIYGIGLYDNLSPRLKRTMDKYAAKEEPETKQILKQQYFEAALEWWASREKCSIAKARSMVKSLDGLPRGQWRKIQKISKDWLTFPDFMIKVAWDEAGKVLKKAKELETSDKIYEILLQRADGMGKTLGNQLKQALYNWKNLQLENTKEDQIIHTAGDAFWETLSQQVRQDTRTEALKKRFREKDDPRSITTIIHPEEEAQLLHQPPMKKQKSIKTKILGKRTKEIVNK